jgi:hypothetical protein
MSLYKKKLIRNQLCFFVLFSCRLAFVPSLLKKSVSTSRISADQLRSKFSFLFENFMIYTPNLFDFPALIDMKKVKKKVPKHIAIEVYNAIEFYLENRKRTIK